MVIKVTELCISMSKSNIGQEEVGTRYVIYETPRGVKTLKDALIEYEDKFDFQKVIETNDDFEGECLDSRIVKVEHLSW